MPAFRFLFAYGDTEADGDIEADAGGGSGDAGRSSDRQLIWMSGANNWAVGFGGKGLLITGLGTGDVKAVGGGLHVSNGMLCRGACDKHVWPGRLFVSM